jgi:hypothetical protein
MENNAVSLSDLPQDIFYYVAKYFDLLEFSALMLTSKSMLSNLVHDLNLQQRFLENTPRKLLHSRSKIPLRTVYIEHIFLRAIKEDITELVALALTNLSFDAVMARIKPMREKGGLLQKQRGPVRRQDLLAKIFEYDAYQVLEYLVNICLAEIELPSKLDHLVSLLSLLAEYSLPDSDKNKATKRSAIYVLSLFKKFEDDLLFSFIYVSTLHDACWGISDVPAMELFAKLLQSQKSFPEYKYDLNKSISSSKLARLPPHRPEHVSLISPLEYVAFLRSEKAFESLIKFGAKFTAGLPYLAIALFNMEQERFADMQNVKFINYLKLLGGDIDQPLPSYLDANRRDILRYYYNKVENLLKFKVKDICFFEYLLALGAHTVLTNEEKRNIENPAYAHHIPTLLLKAQNSFYNFFNQKSTIQLDGSLGKSSCHFENILGIKLEISCDGEAIHNRMTLGKWKQDGSTLRIVLDQKKRVSFVGSGYQTYFKNIEPVTHLFTIAQSFTKQVVLVPSDPQMSASDKILQMYVSDLTL